MTTQERIDKLYLDTDDKLNSAVDAFEYAQEVHADYEEAVRSASGLRGVSYDGVKVQTSHTSYDDALMRVIEFSERYTAACNVYRVARKQLIELFEKAGLTDTQFRVLSAMYLTGNLKTYEVAARMAGCRNKQQAWRTYKSAFCKCALLVESAGAK